MNIKISRAVGGRLQCTVCGLDIQSVESDSAKMFLFPQNPHATFKEIFYLSWHVFGGECKLVATPAEL